MLQTPTTVKRFVLRRRLEEDPYTYPYMITTTARHTGLSRQTTISDFFQKSCAVYITTPVDTRRPVGKEQLLRTFNYFSKRLDIKAALAENYGDVAMVMRDAFPCKFLACWSPRSPHGVSEIQQAHQRICSQIEARQTDAAISHTSSQLHPLFRAVLIIIDRLDDCHAQGGQQRPGLIQLIRSGDDAHLRSGPIDLDPLRFTFWVSDDGNILRGRFENVMLLIMEWRRREDDTTREEEDMETENEF
ncbi:uncharacterized protein TRUGW13939_05007 [Talaromyces rugulosus]|uniref:Uncharacterized protein n=1 Tax=Talaromyces rugulosus TaxID=121627 RepID=A0A7H8QV97_TALRU|nr:uncharacterized protein TRUGW13939_05007 [Talaromyces rugulosus]QKX57887.1 hypothetical protein TRUGW13939_05007 [Talaromyces rugulosus]